ncbi:MAG: YeeE/YedE family protein [Balneolaceae bacterium]|nr:YeeE/YedE family protein [Balneolaceae bacterium]MBO6545231.1 YeeE/YedE family protein [Balneolaceae bacterium]MBO6646627.1 YeeE/YedE family protein [Balneolaceae bacterium]
MNGPFFINGWIGEEASLIFALFIGITFGFFLERAGLGSAKKLAAQFYGTDMTVFKMMFTAIITAMIGLFWFNQFGWLNLELVYLTPTFIAPQIIGGLVFGVGFIVGGYCPGTSCVAGATGSLDGWMNVLGMLTGILVFGEFYPLLESFYNATPMGELTLTDYFNIPFGVMVFILVMVALAGFWASEKIETRLSSKN